MKSVKMTEKKGFSKYLRDRSTTNSNWREQQALQPDIREELRKDYEFLEKDRIAFEQSLQPQSVHPEDFMSVMLGRREHISIMTEVYTADTGNVRKYTIHRVGDIIQEVYAKVQLDSTFDDLPLAQKLELFAAKIEFRIGGCTWSSTTFLAQLFLAICQGQCLEEQDGVLTIPLFAWPSAKVACNKVIGIPHPVYHEIAVIIRGVDLPITLPVKYGYLSPNQRVELVQKPQEFLYVETRTETVETTSEPVSMYNLYNKCILIYFEPLGDYVDYPALEAVYIDDVPYDTLTLDIFDQRLHLVPLTEDFTSWENILELMQDPLNEIKNHHVKYDNVRLQFQSCPRGFRTCYVSVNLNLASIDGGLACLTYAS